MGVVYRAHDSLLEREVALKIISTSIEANPELRERFLRAYDLEFRDSSLLGDQEPQWRNADEASRFELPVEVLPPAIS